MIWENSTETCILSSVKQITSPGWMHETSAQDWCTGKTQRDGMGREVGGGSGWGIHVNPSLIHVNVWQKPVQYCKVIRLQLIKINEKNKYIENLMKKSVKEVFSQILWSPHTKVIPRFCKWLSMLNLGVLSMSDISHVV